MEKTEATPNFSPGEWEVRRGAHSMSSKEWSVWQVGAQGDGEKSVASWMKCEADATLLVAAKGMHDAYQRAWVAMDKGQAELVCLGGSRGHIDLLRASMNEIESIFFNLSALSKAQN